VDQLTDAALASRLVAAAGELLVQLRDASPSASDLVPSELRAAGDRVSQRYLAAKLAETRPGDAVLSEEAADAPGRLTAERVWIVDPLDGTREFAEGRSDWAVHVALWCEDDLAAGAVALPAIGTVLSTAAPPPPIAEGNGHLRIAVSRTRAPALAERVADRLGGELVPLGSAGYKVAAVVLGDVDAYLHAGGQYEWDSAAPVAVARAAGLHTSRLDGSPLQYNQPVPYLPDLVVCRQEVAAALLTAIRENLS
jgi:3'(2'), 5'-bisphosphate nucleotidase